VEEHEVTTEDGYILTLHRIPHGLDAAAAPKRRRRSPVFLGHCLVGSSAIWAFGPRDNSLAFMLADAGDSLVIAAFAKDDGEKMNPLLQATMCG
jgi:lysosomal acid lipase/cholesteryl ester hydrolase